MLVEPVAERHVRERLPARLGRSRSMAGIARETATRSPHVSAPNPSMDGPRCSGAGSPGTPNSPNRRPRAVEEVDRPLVADQAVHPQPAVEVEQVRAAPQQHVLAVVEHVAGLRVFK